MDAELLIRPFVAEPFPPTIYGSCEYDVEPAIITKTQVLVCLYNYQIITGRICLHLSVFEGLRRTGSAKNNEGGMVG